MERKKKQKVPVANRTSLVRTCWRRHREQIARGKIACLSARVCTGDAAPLPPVKKCIGVRDLVKTQFSTTGAPLLKLASVSVKVAEGMGGDESWLVWGGRRNKVALAIGVKN